MFLCYVSSIGSWPFGDPKIKCRGQIGEERIEKREFLWQSKDICYDKIIKISLDYMVTLKQKHKKFMSL